MKRTTCLLLLTVLAAGCDRFGDPKNKQLALERQRQEDVRREQEDLERFAKGLTEYANGRQKIVKETIGRLEGDARALRDDVEKLSKIIVSGGEERDSAGKELPIETKLLRLLRNSEVNDLAKKYLSADFVLLQNEFVDRVRDARADEARYRKALALSDATYSDSLKESQKWVNATKEQREAEIVRVQGEIGSWESRRGSYQKSFQELSKKTLAGNLSKERERREKMAILERKIYDADREILRKRDQIDFLRNPSANAGLESRAAERKQNVQSQANMQRDRELSTIDRYYKPKATVVEVVTEISKRTIERLQGAMAGRSQATEKELADAKRREVEIRECLLAIPISNMTELKALRTKIEK